MDKCVAEWLSTFRNIIRITREGFLYMPLSNISQSGIIKFIGSEAIIDQNCNQYSQSPYLFALGSVVRASDLRACL